MREYCFGIILLAGFLVGCNSSNDNVDGTHPNELPHEYFFYDTELVGEYVIQDGFIGTLDIQIRDVNNLIATLEMVCDNTIDCSGVKQFKYSGTYSTFVFDLKPEIGNDYTIDSIRDNFQKLDLKLRLIEKEKPEFTISFDTSIDVIDTMLMGGQLTLDKVQDGKLHGSVTGLINEFTQFNMSQQCQEAPTADCYTYHNAAVNYKVAFAFTLPND
ncbi:hypothetical protein Ssed_2109 [Shewanella sediminis HAW-EB3]|uniref:Lipoprotein n=1 Tax=Shewanella sediminis (strain HAW-EB3) TaxID=425104 RepID=A8FV45_SHESH|nr:hypothetical protein [Shewanella sediminis]ABV36718.1 hypothetical protein Ssed_2109 [Shewanella sediminis HAW-EB3]